MTPSRFALGLLAVVTGLGAVYLATTDVHYTDRNCGTAVFATDPGELSMQSGDLEQDEFNQESLMTNCNPLTPERRFFVLAPAAASVGPTAAGRRPRDRPDRMSGSISAPPPARR